MRGAGGNQGDANPKKGKLANGHPAQTNCLRQLLFSLAMLAGAILGVESGDRSDAQGPRGRCEFRSRSAPRASDLRDVGVWRPTTCSKCEPKRVRRRKGKEKGLEKGLDENRTGLRGAPAGTAEPQHGLRVYGPQWPGEDGF